MILYRYLSYPPLPLLPSTPPPPFFNILSLTTYPYHKHPTPHHIHTLTSSHHTAIISFSFLYRHKQLLKYNNDWYDKEWVHYVPYYTKFSSLYEDLALVLHPFPEPSALRRGVIWWMNHHLLGLEFIPYYDVIMMGWMNKRWGEERVDSLNRNKK